MQKIITATGKTFQIAWLGASTIDMALRFAVEGEELQSIIAVFISPEELKLPEYLKEALPSIVDIEQRLDYMID